MALSDVKNFFKGDKVIWLIYFFLCMISVVEVYSASSSLGYRTGNYYHAVFRHASFLFGGTLITMAIAKAECRYFKLAVKILYPFSLFLLILVLFIGHQENGASRWLSIGGVSIQPSEIAKGALILTVATILGAMQTPNGAAKNTYFYIMGTTLPIAFFIAPENLSTAVLICVTVFFMMWIGNVNATHLRRTLLVVLTAGALGLSTLFAFGDTSADEKAENTEVVEMAEEDKVIQNSPGIATTEMPEAYKEEKKVEKKSGFKGLTHRMGTWKRRIVDFVTPVKGDPAKYDLDKDGQVGHANIAIASSNGIGVGPGHSVQRDFIAQAYSDFIFAIIIEEFGIIGAIVTLALYIFLFIRSGHIAAECANPFPAFLIMGFSLMLTLQAFFNMCVAVGLLPVTGQPLPLVSRGGTSCIFTCAFIGVILSVSKTAKKRDGVLKRMEKEKRRKKSKVASMA